MRKLSRRKFVAGSALAALAAPAILSRPAHAAEFTYKFANNTPPDHPLNVRAREAAAKILEETGGRLEIVLYPSNQLGSDTNTLSQVRSGAVELFSLSAIILSTLIPETAITGVGFAFKSYDQVWAAVDGPLGAFVRQRIEGTGLVVFDRLWDIGYRQITTGAKPIRDPADLEHLRIRVPPGPLWTSIFQSLGAAPSTLNFNELYTALQTRVFDAQENPLSIIETVKLYEVQKYVSMTNHMWDGLWLLANKEAWNALPPDVREIAARHLNAAAKAERDDIRHLNESLESGLTARGLVFNRPDAAPFQEVLRKAGFYRDWKNKFGADAWTLLEQAAGVQLA